MGPGMINTNVGPVLVFAITVEDRKLYEDWADGWKKCAEARGIVIEEANK